MSEVFFYHLTQRPLEAVLPVLLERSIGRGANVLVRGRDPARMDWLDQALWLGPEDRFLPHGLAGGPDDARQPVLLTTTQGNPNAASFLMVIDGADLAPEEAAMMERSCILFDGNDAAAVTQARGQWKALTAAGCAAQYWSEASGRWEMKVQSGG
ncbi:DNA polymerase III subunit chi [Aquicoccus sp. G2-2]|uniref:DNA polymerase III subunit chi n=1 Tax=Aquicoccus sp. G2-2 TaxID=3092120 RepID=UPI002ADFE5B5|nr:DNA polymerase III subunit chi [Aquicoccus sp. G2-2]MEA1112854.1 DNA polymerase III subunit chi [Aquicoccus sp. G2-2]